MTRIIVFSKRNCKGDRATPPFYLKQFFKHAELRRAAERHRTEVKLSNGKPQRWFQRSDSAKAGRLSAFFAQTDAYPAALGRSHKVTGLQLGAQSLFWPKKKRSFLTVLKKTLGGACGKAAANTPRNRLENLSMKWDNEVPNAARRHLYSPSWLTEKEPNQQTQAKPRTKKRSKRTHKPPSQGKTPNRRRHKRRDHSRSTHTRPGNTPESEHRSAGRTRQQTTTKTRRTHTSDREHRTSTKPTTTTRQRTTPRTRRTHRSTSEAQSGHRPRQAGQHPPQLLDQRPPASAGAQRVGSSTEMIYLKIQPDLAPRERGVNWESCGRDTDCSLLFLCWSLRILKTSTNHCGCCLLRVFVSQSIYTHPFTPGPYLSAVAAFLVLSISEVL